MDCINATGNGSELYLNIKIATFNDVIKYVDSTKIGNIQNQLIGI